MSRITRRPPAHRWIVTAWCSVDESDLHGTAVTYLYRGMSEERSARDHARRLCEWGRTQQRALVRVVPQTRSVYSVEDGRGGWGTGAWQDVMGEDGHVAATVWKWDKADGVDVEGFDPNAGQARLQLVPDQETT